MNSGNRPTCSDWVQITDVLATVASETDASNVIATPRSDSVVLESAFHSKEKFSNSETIHAMLADMGSIRTKYPPPQFECGSPQPFGVRASTSVPDFQARANGRVLRGRDRARPYQPPDLTDGASTMNKRLTALEEVTAELDVMTASIRKMDIAAGRGSDVHDLKIAVHNISQQLAAQSSVTEQLKTENVALRSMNTSLETKVETLSEMQRFQRTTSSAQQGHVDALNDFVRTRLIKTDKTIVNLIERVRAAESAISSHKSSMDRQFTAVSEDMKKNLQAIATLRTSGSTLAGNVDSLEERTVNRLAEVEDKLNADLNSTMSHFADVEGKLDSDMNEIMTLRKQHQGLQQNIKEHTTSIAELTTSADHLHEKAEDLEGKFEGLSARDAQKALHGDVAVVNERISSTMDLMKKLEQDIMVMKDKDVVGIKDCIAILAARTDALKASADFKAPRTDNDNKNSETCVDRPAKEEAQDANKLIEGLKELAVKTSYESTLR